MKEGTFVPSRNFRIRHKTNTKNLDLQNLNNDIIFNTLKSNLDIGKGSRSQLRKYFLTLEQKIGEYLSFIDLR